MRCASGDRSRIRWRLRLVSRLPGRSLPATDLERIHGHQRPGQSGVEVCGIPHLPKPGRCGAPVTSLGIEISLLAAIRLLSGLVEMRARAVRDARGPLSALRYRRYRQSGSRIVADEVKAFEESVFGPCTPRRTPRISCKVPETRPRVRLSLKERRMKFAEPTGPNRKFGAMGHPSRKTDWADEIESI
jgi:hypothetical protein